MSMHATQDRLSIGRRIKGLFESEDAMSDGGVALPNMIYLDA